jgi:GT2 family glycosyltransferase
VTQAEVIISTRGRGALIDVTVSSILASSLTDFALWIVDQSDDDATERAVAPYAQQDPRFHYFRSATRGLSAGRNEGVAAGSAPYLVFTDDDCRVDVHWLAQLVSELQNEGVSAVFGRVIPDETFHDAPPAGRPVSAAIPMALKDAPQRRIYHGNRFDLGFGHGASMGVRRDCYEAIGGFDEMLGVGGPLRSWNDRDLGYRVLVRGDTILYTPAALVHHRHWRDWDAVRRTYRNYATGAGAAAGKYLRCGDLGGLYILAEWMLDQGVRQMLSGLFKWQSGQKISVGLLQLVYPWVGLVQGWRYPIDRARILYRQRPAPAGK